MKILLSVLLFVLVHAVSAQMVEKQLAVGDYIYIKPCKKGQKDYEGMDVYARTAPMDRSKIDSVTGEGVFDAFLAGSSIDAKRLPCIMGGRKYKIAALNEFMVKGELHRVLLCYTGYHLTMIWVELDKAMALGEIDF